MSANRLDRILAAIDEVNSADPSVTDETGAALPRAVLYGQRMSRMLEEYKPDAGELLRIAARAQHIERWLIPRQSYPEGRIGYLSWRKVLQQHHASRTGALMAAEGYDRDEVERVSRMLRKECLKQDMETQILEDVACLVFLVHEAPRFIVPHDDAKVVSILTRTARKMSEEGINAAGKRALDARLKRLLAEATASDPSCRRPEPVTHARP